jgi:poly(3-hydroxybutyrate) depolymerase
MDIYTPDADTATQRPVVLLAHGGTFLTGNKDQEVVFLCEALARRGYVAVSINYRLDDFLNFTVGGNERPVRALVRAVQDMKAAVRYLRRTAHEDGNPYALDTNTIFIGGSSAGSLTALHAAYMNTFEEFEQFTAITNHQDIWDDMGGIEGNSGNAGFSSRVSGVINLAGALGVAQWITTDDLPLISMHGDEDDVVPYSAGTYGVGTISIDLFGSQVLDTVSTARGNFSRLYTHIGAGHVPFVGSAAYQDTTIRFVVGNLGEVLCGISASVAPRTQASSFTLYPNPAQGRFTLRTHTAQAVRQVCLRNVQGQVLRTVNVTALPGQAVEVSVEGLAPGVYLAEVTPQTGNPTHLRVVVQ